MSYIFRSAWAWRLMAMVLVLAAVVAGLCPAHPPSNPAKAKPVMILDIDFIMRAGNEVRIDIVKLG